MKKLISSALTVSILIASTSAMSYAKPSNDISTKSPKIIGQGCPDSKPQCDYIRHADGKPLSNPIYLAGWKNGSGHRGSNGG